MVLDRQPQGTRCEACRRVVLGEFDDVMVCTESGVLCVSCATQELGRQYRYPGIRRSPGQ